MGSTLAQYVVVGTGRANLVRVKAANTQPNSTSPEIVLQRLDDQHVGYLRLIADRKHLHVDFQTVSGDNFHSN